MASHGSQTVQQAAAGEQPSGHARRLCCVAAAGLAKPCAPEPHPAKHEHAHTTTAIAHTRTPEAGHAAGDGGEQVGHGGHDRVDLDIQVVGADLRVEVGKIIAI